MPLHRLQTQPRRLVRPRPERQPGIDHHPDPPRRRRLVPPLRNHENPLPDLHRFQVLPRERHPVPRIRRTRLAPEPLQQARLLRVVIEERTQPRHILPILHFHNARRARFPQLGDRHFFVRLLTIEVN